MKAVRDLRLAHLPTMLGEKIVVRIHEAMTQASASTSWADDRSVRATLRICAKPYGAILFAGPVGAGKNNHTLYLLESGQFPDPRTS